MSGSGGIPSFAALTTEEAARALTPATVLLLPVGSTEAHGPHLPLEADVLIATEIARRAGGLLQARRVSCFLLPAISYATARCAAPFAGTVSLEPGAAAAQVGGIARSLAPAGGALLCLVNGHLEPVHVRELRDAAGALGAEGCRVIFPDYTRRPHVERLGQEFLEGGGHAGGYETSLVLAAGGRVLETERRSLPANRVDLAAGLRGGAADFRDLGGERAYFGDPAAASVAEGERLYGILAAVVADAADEAIRA